MQSQKRYAADVLDALRAVEPDIRDALAAFGYQPLTGLGERSRGCDCLRALVSAAPAEGGGTVTGPRFPAVPPGCCVRAGLPAWLEAKPALAELRELSRKMAETAAAAAAAQAPAVVTFVSNGYEPLLNNWLVWLKHTGADVSRVVVVTPHGHDSAVRGRLLYRGVHVAALDDLEPDQWAPGTSHELGASKDPNRHARARCKAQTHN